MKRIVVIVGATLLLAACGGSDETPPAPPAASPAQSATSQVPAEPTAPLPPGAQAGLDDYDGDGAPDPTCGTQDFGGQLVLRIPCAILNANEPEQGTRLVKDSLFRLPAATGPDLTDVSGWLLAARDAAGGKVFIVVFNSDNLFATGSDTMKDQNTLDATIRVINDNYAGAAIQVRGHTDATGTASANQALSERRAANIGAYLTGHGVKASGVTSAGFGSSRPLVEEAETNGSASDGGRTFNRRVELVLRVP